MISIKKTIPLLLIAYFFSNLAIATVVNIPADYPTIQAGIDAANPGDTVLVGDGVYTGEGNHDIDFGGKNIVLKSQNGPELTIIDCEGEGRGFIFQSGEDSTATIDGFTIMGGHGIYDEPDGGGGGILCNNSSPTIINNVITQNTSVIGALEGGGAGIDCQYSNAIISNNTIVGNYAYGGFWWHDIFGNDVWVETGSGGGINCYHSSPRITNNIIAYNEATFSNSGINIGYTNCDPIISCCNYYGNFYHWDTDFMDSSYFNDMIYDSPRFCNLVDHDYRIASNSPCAPDNNICGTLIGAIDIGCGVNLTTISPDIMYALDAYTYEDIYASISLYNIEENYGIYDIDTSSLLINGSISPVDFEYQAVEPLGEVLTLSFLESEFVSGYVPLWDTTMQAYTITGQFNDLTGFSTVGWVKMIGHSLGDVNADFNVDILDVTYLLSYLYKGGPEPESSRAADVNSSGTINILDVTYLISYLYKGGPAPVSQ